MAFKASPSSQHQHCTDEAQKAETVLSAIDIDIDIDIDKYKKWISQIDITFSVTAFWAS